MTIIFANHKDSDCRLLPIIWKNLNAKVIEITPDTMDWEQETSKAIEEEKDTLIFAGHGDMWGLLHPDFGSGEYILHRSNMNLIHANKVIYFFCYSSKFLSSKNIASLLDNRVNGIVIDGFITNKKEAKYNDIIFGGIHFNQSYINRCVVKIYKEINQLLITRCPLCLWNISLMSNCGGDKLDHFNRRCIDVAIKGSKVDKLLIQQAIANQHKYWKILRDDVKFELKNLAHNKMLKNSEAFLDFNETYYQKAKLQSSIIISNASERIRKIKKNIKELNRLLTNLNNLKDGMV